jgi:Tfp pilus assembly protein PilN
LQNAQNKSGFASTLGLALSKLGTFGDQGGGLINLSMLPQAVTLRRNRQMGVISNSLMRCLVLVMVIIGSWTGGVVLPTFLKSQQQSRGFETIKLDAAASQQRVEILTTQVQQMDEELAQLNSIASQRGKSIILNTIPDLAPDGVELSGYDLKPEQTLTLNGAATDEDAIILFVTETLNSGLVAGATAGEPVLREDGSFYDFEITGQLQQES